MLLQDAVVRARVASAVPFLARATCMALSAPMGGGTVASTGCIGNRVYTNLREDELYVAIPRKHSARVADEVQVIAEANIQLAEYHRGGAAGTCD